MSQVGWVGPHVPGTLGGRWGTGINALASGSRGALGPVRTGQVRSLPAILQVRERPAPHQCTKRFCPSWPWPEGVQGKGQAFPGDGPRTQAVESALFSSGKHRAQTTIVFGCGSEVCLFVC